MLWNCLWHTNTAACLSFYSRISPHIRGDEHEHLLSARLGAHARLSILTQIGTKIPSHAPTCLSISAVPWYAQKVGCINILATQESRYSLFSLVISFSSLRLRCPFLRKSSLIEAILYYFNNTSSQQSLPTPVVTPGIVFINLDRIFYTQPYSTWLLWISYRLQRIRRHPPGRPAGSDALLIL
jgi:hypothetical protein